MSRRYPNLFTLSTLTFILEHGPQRAVTDRGDGQRGWVPGRPLGPPDLLSRLGAAWEVLRGRADAFTWPGGQ